MLFLVSVYQSIFDTLETLPIYSTLGFKSRAAGETTSAAVDAQLQSKHTSDLYNEDPEGAVVREALAIDSDETASAVKEDDTLSSFVTTSEELSPSATYKPEEASPTENGLYSTSEISSSTFNPKPEDEESLTENELYSTSEISSSTFNPKPEDEESLTENELYSTSKISSSTFNPKPEDEESLTENELYSTSQLEPKSSGDSLKGVKPDETGRQGKEHVS